ncbi:MAG TPA: VOC family protein [Polyangia bacterium]
MPQFEPYLTFNGNCAEAMRFYERILGGKIESISTFGETPMGADVPPGAKDQIMHASLIVEGRRLMASDCPPGMPYQGMKGFGVSISYPTPAAAERIFNAFVEGGEVTMPLQKTFWSEAFGMVTDRFGTPWMISGGQQTA